MGLAQWVWPRREALTEIFHQEGEEACAGRQEESAVCSGQGG